jgi:hypothetical protein
MIPAIKIILERIKTNPEEFANGGGRWAMVVQNYWYILTPEEKTQLRDSLREVLVPQFNERVVRELMAHDDSTPKEIMRIGPFGSVSVATQRSI